MTGGTGFVGRAVLGLLGAADTDLRVLARRPETLAAPIDPANIVAADLRDDGALDRLTRNAGTVVHVAGVVAARSNAEFHELNADATVQLARISRDNGVRQFVYVSSLAAREPSFSGYAASKQAAEKALEAVQETMRCIILRPPAVYGPGDRATLPLIQQLSRRHGFVPGTAGARFSLIHVEDLARAIVALTLSGSRLTATTPFELDDGRSGGYDWPEIARIAASVAGHDVKLHLLPRPLVAAVARLARVKAKATGKPGILTAGKVRELYHPDWVARTNLLQDNCDWQPQIGFARGFEQTLSWYRAHEWLPPGPARTRKPQPTGFGDPSS